MPKKKVRRTKRVVRRRKINSCEKGHLFEDVVERYFQLLGYSVERNVKVRGFSGATHEVDVLIERDGVRGVVEAKNYSKPIPKEWIMKAHSVAKDIGASEVYVVSASGFTEDAVKVAEVLGVKLLGLDAMAKEVRRASDFASLPIYHVKPVVKQKAMGEYAQRYVVKKFFKPVEEVDKVELLYHPFYAVDAEYTYVERVGVLFTREVKKRAVVSFFVDAVRNTLLVLAKEEYGRYSVRWFSVPLVSKEEIELLKILGRSGKPMSISEIEKETGWGRQKISKLISNLAAQGLVNCKEKESTSGRVVKAYSVASSPPHIDDVKEANRILLALLEPGGPSDGTIVEPRSQVSNIVSTIASLYDVKVVDKKLVYLPVYRVKFVSTKDDSYRYMCFLACLDPPLLLEGIAEV